MKTKYILIILIMLLPGCSLFSSNVKTTVTFDDGREVHVSSKSDAIVTVEEGELKMTVDNRGRPGFIEQLFGAALVNRDVREKASK